MKKIIVLSLLVVLAFGYQSAAAQDVPHVFDSTQPVDPEVSAAVDAWLAVSNPSTALYYVITYTHPTGFNDTYVSLAGFDNVDNGWNLTGDENGVDHIVWLGTVKVLSDGEVELHTPTQQAMNTSSKMARPDLSPGGGTSISFPWEFGKTMMYGPLGVHGAGFAQNGMVAVDLVGGASMGSGVASAAVYASADGTIDYVCADADSTAIRTSNSNYDTILYAHLLDNAALEMDHVFTARSMIGTLKSGSFGAPNEGCGWADQRPDNYHLHWGVEPANNLYRAGGCVLSTTTGRWTCGTDTVAPSQFLINNSIGGSSDGGAVNTDPTFFDYLIVGVLNFFNTLIVSVLPAHTPSPLITPIMNSVQVVFRVVTVLIMGNLNFIPTITLWIFVIEFKIVFGVIWLVGAILRTIKAIPTF